MTDLIHTEKYNSIANGNFNLNPNKIHFTLVPVDETVNEAENKNEFIKNNKKLLNTPIILISIG